MDFLGMGPWEILLILILALIFLGPGKVADFAKTLGKWTRAIRRAGSDFTTSVTRELEQAERKPPASPVKPGPPARSPPPESQPPQPPPTASQPGPEASPPGKGAPEK